MTPPNDPRDALRDRNLARIARVLTLPPAADAARLARWQQPAPETPMSKRKSFMFPRRMFTLCTSGAAAAALALAVWMTVGQAPAVSAQTILSNFRAALQRSLAFKLEGVDLGNVRIHGDILLDRPDGRPNPDVDRLYSELHVRFVADNSGWTDLQGVSAVCQTPETGWQYCRGNGGMSSWLLGRRVLPTEYFHEGKPWDDFVADPLGRFGSMPLAISFWYDDDGVTYRFPLVQREFVRNLLTFLMSLSSAESAERALALVNPGQTQLRRIDRDRWELTAAEIDWAALLNLAPPPEIDPQAEASAVTTELVYSPGEKRISESSIVDHWPAEFGQLGIEFNGAEMIRRTSALPAESLDGLLAHLRTICATVEIAGEDDQGIRIHVTGFPIPLDTGVMEWVKTSRQDALARMQLVLRYDAATQTVGEAEIKNIAGDSGRVRLQLGDATVTPEQMDPSRWTRSTHKPVAPGPDDLPK